jgi:hypothetical protein
MAGFLTPGNHTIPLFTSEPSVEESGYRKRYPVQSQYAEVKSSFSDKPCTYTFQPTVVPDCTATNDIVALLCMGTTQQTFPANYLDRTLTTGTLTVQFEGQASYTYSGGTLQRGQIKFYTSRRRSEDALTSLVWIDVMGLQAANLSEDDGEFVTVTVGGVSTGTVLEESGEFVSVTTDNNLSASEILEGNGDSVSVTVEGNPTGTVLE